MIEKNYQELKKEYEDFLETETGRRWKEWHQKNTKGKGSLDDYLYEFCTYYDNPI